MSKIHSHTDPVCGMTVSEDAKHRFEHAGEVHRFCSAGCREKFEADPKRYLEVASRSDEPPAPEGTLFTCPMHPDVEQVGHGDCPKCGMALEPKGVPAVATRTEWTCPMHPEIVRDAPGDCPKCEMALEPRSVTLDEEENPELRDMSRRFWFATALSIPLVAIVMLDMPGRPISGLLPGRTRAFVELALATPVCLWSAWPFYVRAVRSVKNLSLNMFTLIGLGVSVAYVYSVVATLLPEVFPPSFRGHGGEVAVYFEAAGVIVMLILLGQVLALRARSQTRRRQRRRRRQRTRAARAEPDRGRVDDVGARQGATPRLLSRGFARAELGGLALVLVASCTAPRVAEIVKDARAPSPKSVPIGSSRRSTEGEVALRNLDGQISERRRLIADRGGDIGFQRALVDSLLFRAAYTGAYDDFDDVDRLTQADVAEHPTTASAWTSRAGFLSAVHRFSEARIALDRALALGASEDRVARSQWVIALALGEDSDALVERAEERREAFPSFRSIADHGTALAAAGRFEEADAAYVSSLATYRDVSAFVFAWVAFQRGVMWAESADRPDLAVPLYEEAVRRLPGYVVANVHLAELEAEMGNTASAMGRLEPLAASVGDPEPGGLLGELIRESNPAESMRLAHQAGARYDQLLSRHRAAFLDHGAEFFSGPGEDTARGLALARENLELRPTARAYVVAIESATAHGDGELACEYAASAELLRSRHPVLDHLIQDVCP